jgi:ACT domain-containing protein
MYLKLSGVYRYKAERISEQIDVDLSQKFCLAITIKDRSGQHEVYNHVAQLLDQNNFVHQRIELRPEVRVIIE